MEGDEKWVVRSVGRRFEAVSARNWWTGRRLRREHCVRGMGGESEAVHVGMNAGYTRVPGPLQLQLRERGSDALQVLTGTAHPTLRMYCAKSAPRKTARCAQEDMAGIRMYGRIGNQLAPVRSVDG
jgi:hypothetical protein